MTAELFLSQASDLRPHFTIPAIARGIGHPDEIARGCADAAVAALEEEAARAGVAEPVFSLGSTVLLPGIAVPRFGGGRTGSPMRILLAGTGRGVPRRTHADLQDAAAQACVAWMRAQLRFVDPARHLAVELHLRDPAPVRTPSIAVARAPLSASQFLASEVVVALGTEEFRRLFPEVGDDAEASALATGGLLRVAVAAAFVDRQVHSERAYLVRKEEMGRYLTEKLRALPTDFDRIEVTVNPDDVPGSGESGLALTVLGTTADGRRPGRAEPAPEGERTSANAGAFARMIVARVRGVRAAVVRLDEDDRGEIRRAFVRVELEGGSTLEAVRPAVHELVPHRTARSRKIDPNALG